MTNHGKSLDADQDSTQSTPHHEMQEMEMVRKAAQEADRLRARNHALVMALNKAGDELRQIKTQMAQLSQPPISTAIFVRVDSVRMESGIQRANVEVVHGNRHIIVTVLPSVKVDHLSPGQRVFLDENLIVVRSGDYPTQGSIRRVKQILDATRIVVADAAGNQSVVRRCAAIANTELRIDDAVLVHTDSGFVLAVIQESEGNELVLEEAPDVSFSDIGGLDSQIQRIRDAVELPYLHRDLYERFGLKPPQGVLLYGPPGNGKTLIAKAVAHSLAQGNTEGVFLSVKGPEVLSKFVGEAERIVRSVFARARERASSGVPVVVFIDEMDSLLRTRGTGISSDVETTIVPQFLSELDGIEELSNVLVIGASNRVDMIDPAILRPGRLDVKIRVDRPGKSDAASILLHYLADDLPFAQGLSRKDAANSVIEDIFAHASSRKVCDVIDVNSHTTEVFMDSLISGAMLKNIVDRAKTKAIKASIEADEPVALSNEFLHSAVSDEYLETVDSVAQSNPEQWALVNSMSSAHILSGSIAHIIPVSI